MKSKPILFLSVLVVVLVVVSCRQNNKMQKNSDLEFLKNTTSNLVAEPSEKNACISLINDQPALLIDFTNNSKNTVKSVLFTFTINDSTGSEFFKGFKVCYFEDGFEFPDLKAGQKVDSCTLTESFAWFEKKHSRKVLFADTLKNVNNPEKLRVKINDYFVIEALDGQTVRKCGYSIKDQKILPK